MHVGHLMINHQWWKVERVLLEDPEGCWWGDSCNERRLIRVDQRASASQLVDTLVHEILHASLWYLDEEVIAQTATDLVNALEQIGYRKSLIAELESKEADA